jgi:hypothetical protein
MIAKQSSPGSEFSASCHCGNLKLFAKLSPVSLTSCNCSICYRLGALWAYYNRAEVEIVTGDQPAASYTWARKTIRYHHCANCGCTTHYTSTERDGNELVAINARMAPVALTSQIPIRQFDGLVSWRYLDE